MSYGDVEEAVNFWDSKRWVSRDKVRGRHENDSEYDTLRKQQSYAVVLHSQHNTTLSFAFDFEDDRQDFEQWYSRTTIHAKRATSEAGGNHESET